LAIWLSERRDGQIGRWSLRDLRPYQAIEGSHCLIKKPY
jgi:hypothetical protein